jgi:hypothetical protein
MPKVKNPLLSMEARGGIGGLVFNTWRGINYVKTNTSPTGQGTELRLAAQAIIIAVSRQWAGIGDVARAAWNQYAIDHPVTDWTGSPKRLTGMNWYVACNVQLTRLGNVNISTPPVVDGPDAPTGIALSKNASDLFIDWDTPVAANLAIIFFLVGPKSAGITGKIEMAKYQVAYGGNAPTPTLCKAAAPIGTYTVFAKVMDPATGLCSSWVSNRFTMT